MVDIQTLSVVIAAASVVVGVVTFIMNNRREAKQRDEQLIFQRFQGYGFDYARSNVELAFAEFDNVEDFRKKYGSNPEFVSRWNYVFSVYNMAGISLKRGADPDLVFQLYSPNSTIALWEKFEPMTKRHRERTNNPLHREPFEFLYNEAKKRNPELKGYVQI
jgi:hypothetical protein